MPITIQKYGTRENIHDVENYLTQIIFKKYKFIYIRYSKNNL